MSIRLILVSVAIIAIGLAWTMHRVRVQMEGIELIRRHGGMYYYDFEYDDAKFPSAPRSWAPYWLIKNLGIDLFHHVAWVRVEDPRFDDDTLGQMMSRLPRIESIGIVGTSITDEGLLHLRGNRRLKGLTLGRNCITDAGLDILRPETMPVLEYLDIRGTDISAAKTAKVEAILVEREAVMRKKNPGVKVSKHMVLSGRAVPLALGPDPRGQFERKTSSSSAGP